ncbi:MAG TPA: FAD-binding protein [Beijerinckiaceae bacterium]|nr:FAD-binding protein [Beijerinckiaceae bacterium]
MRAEDRNNADLLSPASEAEAAAIIADARAKKRRLMIEGGGTRAGLGQPVEADAVLSTRALSGITLYEPAEMVMSARAGTPLAEVARVLGETGQRLAFEPMDHRRLYNLSGEPTIGAVAACNISGPRRVQAGATRDHLIGLRLVNGFGDIVKSGGRVMKNVTGLDLVKLNCGAHGSLGLLTEVTFKVLPRTGSTGTLVIDGLDDARAITALSMALGSPFSVSGAAHLPAGVGAATARTLVRIEHNAASVDYRLGRLATLLAPFGASLRLGEDESAAFWRDIGDCAPLAEPRSDLIWRLSVAPSHAPGIVAAIGRAVSLRHFYDWGGGLIWLAIAPSNDAAAGIVRQAIAAAGGGHATLVRAPAALRATIPVFEPLAEPLMRITRGIKASFDPDGVLNPGRMVARV